MKTEDTAGLSRPLADCEITLANIPTRGRSSRSFATCRDDQAPSSLCRTLRTLLRLLWRSTILPSLPTHDVDEVIVADNVRFSIVVRQITVRRMVSVSLGSYGANALLPARAGSRSGSWTAIRQRQGAKG
jgi:hypothetical protein